MGGRIGKSFYKRGWLAAVVIIIVLIVSTTISGCGGSVEGNNKPTYEYKIIENEKTNLGNSERTSLRVVTYEKLNQKQIETLLNKIEKKTNYNKKKDQLYIYLYDDELIADAQYSLGRLVNKDNETKINLSEKDWSKQPTKEEYEIYKKFIDKTIELAKKDIFEDDDYVANEVSKENNVEIETILENIKKVNSWIMSGF